MKCPQTLSDMMWEKKKRIVAPMIIMFLPPMKPIITFISQTLHRSNLTLDR